MRSPFAGWAGPRREDAKGEKHRSRRGTAWPPVCNPAGRPDANQYNRGPSEGAPLKLGFPCWDRDLHARPRPIITGGPGGRFAGGAGHRKFSRYSPLPVTS